MCEYERERLKVKVKEREKEKIIFDDKTAPLAFSCLQFNEKVHAEADL